MSTITYAARGFTDEVTQCEVCGKPELKGTIRLAVIGEDGDETGEIYAGSTCGARLSGRKATDLRSEARRADDTRYQAELAVHQEWECKRVIWQQQLLEKNGLRWAKPADLRAFFVSETFQIARAEFLVTNREVARPALPRRP